MSSLRANYLPSGLPASLTTGSQGFDALCDLLGLRSRQEKQRVRNHPFAKEMLKPTRHIRFPGMKTADRMRHDITVLFSLPGVRRGIWEWMYERTGGFENMMLDDLPCLEYLALRNFGANFSTKSLADEISDGCEDFFDAEASVAEWQRPALAELPSVREDLRRWSSLDSDRQKDTALAAFAVASILDDARLLRWAAGEVEELAIEFAFVCESEEEESLVQDESDRLESEISEACRKLIDAAHALENEPLESSRFDEVSTAAKTIEDLRDEAIATKKSMGAQAFVDRIVLYFEERAEGEPALLKQAAHIRDLWTLAYEENENLALSSVAETLKRVGDQFDAWTEAKSKFEEATQQLRMSEESLAKTPSDMDVELEVATKKVEQLSTRNHIARIEKRILEAIRPPSVVQQHAKRSRTELVDSPTPSADVLKKEVATSDESTDKTIADEVDVKKPVVAEEVQGGKAAEEKLAKDEQEESGPQPKDGSRESKSEKTKDENQESNREINLEFELPSVSPDEIERERKFTKAEAALWENLHNGRIGIAYHIAKLLQGQEECNERIPSSELLAAVSLGAHLREQDSEVAQTFENQSGPLYGDLVERDADQDTRDAFNLLLFSAALRPAIFAPHTGGLQLLKRVEFSAKLSTVYELATAVSQSAVQLQGVRFSAENLQGALDASAWNKQWKDYLVNVKNWRAALQSEQFLFGPARRVWMRWQLPGGILNNLGGALSKDSPDGIRSVKEIIATLTDTKALDKLVQDTRRQELGVKSPRIFGRAMKQIERDAARAVTLGQTWIQLINSRPDNNDFVDRIVKKLREDFAKLGPVAITSIKQVGDKSENIVLQAALSCAERVCNELLTLFQRGFDSARSNQSSAAILSHSLLYVDELDITTDCNISEDISPESALELLINTASHSNSLSEAFDTRLNRRDILGAKIAHNLLNDSDTQEYEEREQRIKAASDAKQKSLYERLDELSEKLEQSYVAVEVPDSEHARMNGLIVNARSALHDEQPIEDVENFVEGFCTDIEDLFAKSVAEMTARVKQLPPRKDDLEKALLDDAIRNEELIALHEFYGRIVAEQPLLPTDSREPRNIGSFLASVQEIEAQIVAPDSALKALSMNEDYCGLLFSELSEEQKARSKRLIDTWYKIARAPTEIGDVGALLTQLGFEVRRSRMRGRSTVAIQTEPLRDRTLCPSHTFGSELNGSYKILLNFRPQAHEAIVQALSKAPPTDHPIVLHFGTLGKDRESLRVWGVRNGRKFLTVDTTLLLYLASLSGNWLRNLFACTLPFSAAVPFVTDTAGLVPPELFYGRARDRQSIMDRSGSCFVYGGRQLGKTALLRSARDLFNRPESGQLAMWIDLKARDVGVAHGADHIWIVIWETLKALGIIEEANRLPRRSEHVATTASNAVSNWLAGEVDRRILLLLDEADPFLAADAENDFHESVKLKQMMEDTDRRFKVVFSGLHNVLRTTERANHPLAHFGEPICVGPLLNNGEWEQARALIQEPLAAAGYAFEKDTLPTHILAWTNYYPSLIQLFGAELVNHLRNDLDRSVPYSVSMKDINAVWANEKLRASILDKFRLTLNLDERYLVTASALALELQGSNLSRESGLLQQELFDLVCVWWPEGFVISDREFNGLLGEMQGLGVLRAERDGERRWRYRFRNPNMHRLFEEAVDIQAELTKAHALPDAFDKHTFHAKYPSDRPSVRRRSPLSFEQEGKLRRRGGITVLTGVAAANIDQIEEYLRDSLNGNETIFSKLELCTNEAELAKQLGLQRPASRSIHVYLVHKDSPWTFQWVDRTATTLRRLKRGRSMRIVFQAPPKVLWQFMSGLPRDHSEITEDIFEWIELFPWTKPFLRRWCADHNLLADTHQVDDLLELSGGWPSVLEKYARNSTLGDWKANATLLNNYIEENSELLLRELGLGQMDVRMQLGALMEYEIFDESEASQLSSWLVEGEDSSVDGRDLVQRLRWTKRLGLMQNHGGAWSVNPLLERLLATNVK